MLHMLSGRHQKFPNWPQHQILLGMNLAMYLNQAIGNNTQNYCNNNNNNGQKTY